MSSLLRLLSVGLLLLVSMLGFAQNNPIDRGRLMVKFKASASPTTRQAALASVGAKVVDSIGRTGIQVLRVANFASAAAAVQQLKNRPDVEFAEVDELLPLASDPNDPLYSSQWHLPKINAPAAWNTTTGSPSIIIAICDTGVNPTHPDLLAHFVPGTNIYDGSTDTHDVYGHGTMVAGCAAAVGNNGIGVASVAYSAKIMPVRVSEPNGSAYMSKIAQGLIWAADNGARVANVSYEASTSVTVSAGAQYMYDRGGVVCIAAGNGATFVSNGDNPYVLTVSATDSSDNLASFTNTGNNIDVAAPGVGIYTTTNSGGYGGGSGTSFASPVAAGVAALVLSVNPALSAAEAQQIVRDSADDLGPSGWDSGYGWGRVNAGNAVALASGGADTEPPTLAFTAPANNATVSGTVNVTLDATDNVGVASVELFVDMAPIGTDTSAPYAFSWDSTTVANGSRILTATAKDAAGNSITKQITVNVQNADVTPPTVSFTAPSNGATVSGSVNMQATASDNVGVASVEFFVDGVSKGIDSSAPYSMSWDSTAVANGNHTLKATAKDAAGNAASAQITVNVQNADVTPPTVAFTAPSNGATVSGTVSVQGTASDNIGVASVEFFVDGVSKGVDTSAPYSFSWNSTAAANGTHTLKLTAKDAANNAASAQITVNVQNADVTPPTVSFAAPSNGATVSDTVSVLANASDNVGVASVEFFVDGVSQSIDMSAPYSFSWGSTAVANGTHTLKLTAKDAANNAASAQITVDVQNADVTPPTLSFTAPTDGATVSGTISVQLSASDNVGVASVELFVDMAPLGTKTSAPYTFSWDTTTVANGDRVLTATAKDAAGNTTTKQITVHVNNADVTPPTVSFSAPANGATVMGSVNMQATASDNVGVASVEFFVDGVSKGIDSSAPYTMSWDSTAVGNGNHVLKATAKDAAGNAASAQITVNVDNLDTTPPTVSFLAPSNGATVFGSVTVQIAATDNIAVASVELFVDGVSQGVRTAGQYNFTWNTLGVGNGNHVLLAVAKDAANNSASAQITVNVQNADTTPPTVSFLNPLNGATVSGTVAVQASASDNIGIASVQLFVDGSSAGTVLGGGPYNFTWNTTGLGNGNHTLSLLAKDAANNSASAQIVVNVQNQVVDTTPPSLNFVAPADGATVSGVLSVQLSASDNVGVTSVELLVDMAPIGTLTSAPYTFSWDSKTVANGDRVLTATAKDAAGNSTTKQITVHVNNADVTPPTVSLTAPANGATVSGSVSVQATASDNVGVASVEFFVDGVSKGIDSSAPYSMSWDSTGAANGNHVLKATAKDAAGNAASAQITVNVQNADTTPPTLAFTAPANGATVSGTVGVQLSASDNVGVVSVQLFVDGVSLGTDTSAPYSFSWNTTTVANGSHVLSATAKDAANNLTMKQITVNVQNQAPDTTPPSLSIDAPADGAVVTGGVNVLMSASDNVGVASVEFFVDGVSQGIDTSAPYAFAWNSLGAANGSHVLSATAKDAAGNATTKQITVDAENLENDVTPPTVRILRPFPEEVIHSRAISVFADAWDNFGVARVELYVDGVLHSESSTAPFTTRWKLGRIARGTHTLQLKAYDLNGNMGVSEIVIVRG